MKIKNRSKRVANKVALVDSWSRRAHKSAKLALTSQEEFRRDKKRRII